MTARRVELHSGLWNGRYEQYGRWFPQKMTLEFADGLVRGDGVDSIGHFVIEGEYRVALGEVRIGWIKTYERAHSVLYLGALDDQHIVGDWSLSGARGTFTLHPVRAGAHGAPGDLSR